ncbi:GntG family PLP-dependent aldolase [Geomicrobium sp. JCM 19055]|uniref:GntG family PLP-dependent aldolase n=1 Tax=Geomicrobium sp. JCM 19055 TaxID=1460649 RepID=UPI000B0671A5
MIVDLRSDTVTKPTQQMREAIFHAEVGDDVYGEDPTINQLEKLAANKLGKESGLFVTSGTQGNLLAVLSQTERGDEVIIGEESHIFYSETGAIASIAGVQTRALESVDGRIPISKLINSIRTTEDLHQPKTGLICLENTHARSGGSILPLHDMEEVYKVSNKHNIPIHLDGSRIFNASTALNIDVRQISQYANTVLICLSKGLSAPMGSILLGSKETILKARRWRKALGGGTRQVGIVGAAGKIALETMVERLEDDHILAKTLAENLNHIPGLQVINTKVETNIVIVSLKNSAFNSKEMINFFKKQRNIS